MAPDPGTFRSLKQMFEGAIPATAKALPFIAILSAILAALGPDGRIAGMFLLGTTIAILIAAAAGLVLIGMWQLVGSEHDAAHAIDARSDPNGVSRLLFVIQIIALCISVADFYVFHLPYYPHIVFFVIFAGIGVYQRWVAEQQRSADTKEQTLEGVRTAVTAQPATRSETRAGPPSRAARPATFGRRTV